MNWQFSSKRRARDVVDSPSHLGFVKLRGRGSRINCSELNVRVFELKLMFIQDTFILCRKSESFSWWLPFCSVVCFFSEAEERNTWMNESSKGWGGISRCHLYKYPAYADHLQANVSCVTSLFSLKTLTEKSVTDFFCCTVQSLSWSFPSIFLDMSPDFSEGIPTPRFLSAMNYGHISLKLSRQLCSGLFHVLLN